MKTSPRSPLTKLGAARVQKLAAYSLTTKAYLGSGSYGWKSSADKGYKTEAWQWRARNSIGAPQQSPVPILFVGNDEAVVSTLGGGIALLDLQSGDFKWKKDLPIGVGAKPLVRNQKIYVAGMDAWVYCLDRSSGQELWKSRISAESLGGISSAEGFLYVPAGDNSLWALDEKTGKTLWTYKRPAGESSILWSLRGQATPLLSADGKKLYLGFSDATFVALEAISGQTLWERRFDRSGLFKDADTSAVLSKNGRLLYVSLVDGDFLALNIQDASVAWSLHGGSHAAPFYNPDEDMLYIPNGEGKVQKVNAADGNVLWTFQLGKRGLPHSPVLVASKFVAVSTTHSGVFLLDKDSGQLVWEDVLGSGVAAAPSTDGKRLAVMGSRNLLYLYSVENRQAL